MAANDEIKQKLYKETLNQLAKTMPSYKDDDVLATTWEDANTELYVIEVEDIKNAINFAINKTYAEARSDTAKEIFNKLDRIIVYRYKYKNNHVQIATGTEVIEGDYDYEAFLATFREYIEIKEQYGVD